MNYHLVQFNIAKAKAAMDDPLMKEFVDNLEPVNKAADESPGFIWRLQAHGTGDATSLQPFDDPRIIINMSVWVSVETLKAYIFKDPHLGFMRRRSEWFERITPPFMVLWWIAEGEIPTVEDAKRRLEKLSAHGSTPEAFTFKDNFPPP